MPPLPSVFVSHGTPMMALNPEDPVAQALALLADRMPHPAGVVVLSSHAWGGRALRVGASNAPLPAHRDFAGFPPLLGDITWQARGDAQLAQRVLALIRPGLPERDPQFHAVDGLDHGAWMPLRWMYPAGDIAVVPLSLPLDATPRDVLRLGTLLAPLRREGILLLGSGGVVHNLERLQWAHKNGAALPFAVTFEAWVRQCLEMGRVEDLATFEDKGPQAHLAHPTPEHFLPLLFTLGAALSQDVLNIFIQGIQYRSLSMLSFCLQQPSTGPRELGTHG
jgi:4,5-DOPA dioxygenase extradiol